MSSLQTRQRWPELRVVMPAVVTTRFTSELLGALSRWDANHWRDAAEVGRLLHFMDDEPGDASSPVAHAVACLRGVDADEVARNPRRAASLRRGAVRSPAARSTSWSGGSTPSNGCAARPQARPFGYPAPEQ